MKKDAMQVIKGSLRLLDFEEITSLTSLQQVTKYVGTMNIKLIVLGLAGIGVLIIGLMMLISPRSRRQQRRKKFEIGLLNSGYGIVAGGLLIFIIFFSGIQSGFYEHLAIQVSYLRESISYLIEGWFKMLSLVGLPSAGIGFILMVPYWHKLYKKCIGGGENQIK